MHVPVGLCTALCRFWQTNLDTLAGVMGLSRGQMVDTVAAYPTLLAQEPAELHS